VNRESPQTNEADPTTPLRVVGAGVLQGREPRDVGDGLVPLGLVAFLDDEGDMEFALDEDLGPGPSAPFRRLDLATRLLLEALDRARAAGIGTWRAERVFDAADEAWREYHPDHWPDNLINRLSATASLEAFRLFDRIERAEYALRRRRGRHWVPGRALHPSIGPRIRPGIRPRRGRPRRAKTSRPGGSSRHSDDPHPPPPVRRRAELGGAAQ
jgi:hypothetical protein